MPSIAQAKKLLYDFMDKRRPWASCNDVYSMMEEIVAYAAFAFRNEQIITPTTVKELENHLVRFTLPLKEHPKGYDGPCGCQECRDSVD